MRVIQRCNRWLDRSGGLPLNIRISTLAHSHDSPMGFKIQKGVDSLITTLQTHSRRWRYLDIRTPFSLHVMHDECPLEYLCISLHPDPAPPSMLMKCKSLPNLRKVYLSSVSLDCIHIPWDNITHIKLASPLYISDCQNVFRRCPKLVYCSFSSVIKGRVEGNAVLDTIRLPSLKFLELGRSEWSTDALMPCNLELPALEELRYGYWSEAGSLLSLLKHSSCRLQSLILDNTNVPWSDFASLLENTPDLKRLSLRTGQYYTRLFTELSKTTEGLLPNLEILDYSLVMMGPHISWPTLASLLEDICNSSSTFPDPRDIPSVTPRPLKAIILTTRSRKGPDAQSIPKFMGKASVSLYNIYLWKTKTWLPQMIY